MPPQRQTTDVIVRDIRNETPDIRSFVLERPDGGLLPPFEAGAHVDVEPLPGLVRQYSLVGSPSDRTCYLIGVKKEPQSRGGSSAMHSVVKVGSTITISKPKNNFALKATAGRRILLAGGIGVTPLLSMAQALHEERHGFELHYFTRTNGDMAFETLLSAAPWRSRVMFHFGVVPPVLNEFLQTLLAGSAVEDQIYMCGPAPFMDVVRDVALSTGWSEDRIFFEHFSAAPPELPLEGDSFFLRLKSNDREFLVPPDKTIVEVLREAGLEVTTSCEQGICGTCVTRCLEGEPDHRDMFLTDEEREDERLFTPCVSRALSKLLVLDM